MELQQNPNDNDYSLKIVIPINQLQRSKETSLSFHNVTLYN